MSKQPVVKPKTTASKQTSKPDDTKPKQEEIDDEAYARQLQQELYSEQEESDAQLARRLHEEEQSKQQTLPFPMHGHPGRPMSATPLHHLFRTLYHMRAQPLELEDDDDANTTPAMEPESPNTTPVLLDTDAGVEPEVSGASAQGETASGSEERTQANRRAPFKLRGAGRSPDRPRRVGINRSPERAIRGRPGVVGIPRRASNDGDPPGATGIDPLPGVRVNPARTRYTGLRGGLHGGRRIIVRPESGEPETETTNVRPITALRRPDLGPREDTFTNLPAGEFDPDFMVLDLGENETTREDNFLNMMRDPFLLMLLLMGRQPGLMVPDDVDLNDYEALWDLAERLGEVRGRGMKDEEINKLPKRTCRGAKGEKCSICLCEFQNGNELLLLPCKHEYHKDCLEEWLKRNASCPVCRQDVKKGGRGAS